MYLFVDMIGPGDIKNVLIQNIILLTLPFLAPSLFLYFTEAKVRLIKIRANPLTDVG